MERGKGIAFVHAWISSIHVFPSIILFILFVELSFRWTQEMMHIEFFLLFNFFPFVVLDKFIISPFSNEFPVAEPRFKSSGNLANISILNLLLVLANLKLQSLSQGKNERKIYLSAFN